jgi:hypothetical protein
LVVSTTAERTEMILEVRLSVRPYLRGAHA